MGGYPERVYQQAANASDGIDKLDTQSLEQSVRRAASEIKKVADRMDPTSNGADKIHVWLSVSLDPQRWSNASHRPYSYL